MDHCSSHVRRIQLALSTLVMLLLAVPSLIRSGNDQKPLIQYQTRHLKKELCAEIDSAKSCSEASIGYIEVIAAPNEAVKDSLNRFIQDFEFRNHWSVRTFDSGALAYLRDFDNQLNEETITWMGWIDQSSISVAMDTCGIFSLRMHWWNYCNTPHINTHSTYKSFDIVSGHRLLLVDVLRPGFEDTLTALGEQEFKRLWRLRYPEKKDDGTIREYSGKNFALNDNYLFSPGGIEFQFNEYEMDGYIPSGISIIIPYNNIRAFIKPDGLLAPFIGK